MRHFSGGYSKNLGFHVLPVMQEKIDPENPRSCKFSSPPLPPHQLIKRLESGVDVVADCTAIYESDSFYKIIQDIVVQIKIVYYFC